MPQLTTFVDARPAEQITDEIHVIGEDVDDRVFLNQLPSPGGAITVTGSGGTPTFTEVASSPAAGEYALVEGQSEIIFAPADAGTIVEVDYQGTGSEFQARDWNRMHSKMQGVKVLVDGATISLDFNDEWVNEVTLAGDRTVDVANFPPSGAAVVFRVNQDPTGTRLITWDGTDFDFGDLGEPVLTTTANKFDLLSFYSDGSTLYFMGIITGYTV